MGRKAQNIHRPNQHRHTHTYTPYIHVMNKCSSFLDGVNRKFVYPLVRWSSRRRRLSCHRLVTHVIRFVSVRFRIEIVFIYFSSANGGTTGTDRNTFLQCVTPSCPVIYNSGHIHIFPDRLQRRTTTANRKNHRKIVAKKIKYSTGVAKGSIRISRKRKRRIEKDWGSHRYTYTIFLFWSFDFLFVQILDFLVSCSIHSLLPYCFIAFPKTHTLRRKEKEKFFSVPARACQPQTSSLL